MRVTPDDLLRSLARAMVHQATINADLRVAITELQTFNLQQVEINQDVKTTLARLETLLARIIPHSTHGRDT